MGRQGRSRSQRRLRRQCRAQVKSFEIVTEQTARFLARPAIMKWTTTMSNQTPVRVQELPYRLRDTFLSTPELALLRALQEMVGPRYIICPKVSLNDIFYIVPPKENVHFLNKFFRKHVDFLLCDPKTFKPVIGIELVKPVSKSETREADQFMEDLFLS